MIAIIFITIANLASTIFLIIKVNQMTTEIEQLNQAVANLQSSVTAALDREKAADEKIAQLLAEKDATVAKLEQQLSQQAIDPNAILEVVNSLKKVNEQVQNIDAETAPVPATPTV